MPNQNHVELFNPIGFLLEGYINWMYAVGLEPNIAIDTSDYFDDEVSAMEAAESEFGNFKKDMIAINLSKDKVIDITVNETSLTIDYKIDADNSRKITFDAETATHIFASEHPENLIALS